MKHWKDFLEIFWKALIPSGVGNKIRSTKSGPNGRPYAEVLVPAKASLDQLISAQEILYTDGLKAVGLRACGGCFSGLDFLIRQQFENVIQIG